MEPYNVKIITFPDMSKQVRIYSETIGKDQFMYPVLSVRVGVKK